MEDGTKVTVTVMNMDSQNSERGDILSTVDHQAAEQGNAEAQCQLGWMYQHGHGVEQSDEEAVAWYRKAADQGNATAQCSLGGLYADGRGVGQSDAEAMAWYGKAAGQGNAYAQFSLGMMYKSSGAPFAGLRPRS
jgi:TPR repeat protein